MWRSRGCGNRVRRRDLEGLVFEGFSWGLKGWGEEWAREGGWKWGDMSSEGRLEKGISPRWSLRGTLRRAWMLLLKSWTKRSFYDTRWSTRFEFFYFYFFLSRVLFCFYKVFVFDLEVDLLFILMSFSVGFSLKLLVLASSKWFIGNFFSSWIIICYVLLKKIVIISMRFLH